MISPKCEKKNVYVVNTGCWNGPLHAETLKEAKQLVKDDLRHEIYRIIFPCIKQFDKRRWQYITAEVKLTDIKVAKEIHKLYEKYKEHI